MLPHNDNLSIHLCAQLAASRLGVFFGLAGVSTAVGHELLLMLALRLCQ